MKKLFLLFLLGSPMVLSAMIEMDVAAEEEEEEVPSIKRVFNMRLDAAIQQIRLEANRNQPNWQEVKAHTAGLGIIRNQISANIPADENQAVMHKFNAALSLIQKAYRKAAQNNPGAVTVYLRQQLVDLNQEILNNYLNAGRAGQINIEHKLGILKAVIDGATQSLSAVQQQQVVADLAVVQQNYFQVAAQAYAAQGHN